MKNGKPSLRDRILAAEDLKTETVEVPEWGVTLCLRELSVAQRLALSRVNDETNGYIAHVVAMMAVDEDGGRIFSDEDIEALAGKAAEPMRRLMEAANRINGVKPLQEAEKNSAPSPSDSSSSA